MNKKLFLGAFLLMYICTYAQQTTQFTVFDNVLYYDTYTSLLSDSELLEPVSPDIIRHSNTLYAKKLTAQQLASIGNTLSAEVTINAACDNYDRLGHVYLSFVPKGQQTYNTANVLRTEIARFITPFMNKNVGSNEVSYQFSLDNISYLLSDTATLNTYDIWAELDVSGVPYAAQTQVAGCTDRIDTFYGTLTFTTGVDTSVSYADDMEFISLSTRENLNNYNATDVTGETTKLMSFTIQNPINNAYLYLITSNHGANSNGEEYNRRRHFVYLDNNLIYNYIPGGKSCEPYRQYNTQGNGIYHGKPTGFNNSPHPRRYWMEWNNWCPGDKIPIRKVALGNLTAGTYTLKIDVPDAVFSNGEGYIPVTAYIQNRDNATLTECTQAYDISLASNQNDITVTCLEYAHQWEILYGKIEGNTDEDLYNSYYPENFALVNPATDQHFLANLQDNTVYQVYVRSICQSGNESLWSEPYYIQVNESLSVLATEKPLVKVYPNPVTDVLNITSDNQPVSEINIYNTLGQLQGSTTQDSINISHLSRGVYLVKVRLADDKEQSFQVIKK
ncbi:hypothetical protein GGR32_001117 [Mesonia hippocampi]|uniref:Peptide-N-glycosidase F N-terminal domain-containing protein n=1 Tax=Mesonia hippocampi TaxID=1628250 RepID=A0A840ETP8_9FLAO|nr:peptide-N-glycosidase F-related protein [Mesonia hippocampi]MBB4118826.1 hypothetical protein [Mesonia hippocampi]